MIHAGKFTDLLIKCTLNDNRSVYCGAPKFKEDTSTYTITAAFSTDYLGQPSKRYEGQWQLKFTVENMELFIRLADSEIVDIPYSCDKSGELMKKAFIREFAPDDQPYPFLMKIGFNIHGQFVLSSVTLELPKNVADDWYACYLRWLKSRTGKDIYGVLNQ